MTSAPPTAATTHAVTPLDAGPLRRVVAVLCFTEIVSWGVLFYAFPVLVATISRDQHWSLPGLIAIFTLAQIVAAIAGLWVGRHLDRHGPRRLMTAGSVLAVVATVAVALTPNLWSFAAAWVLAGFAMSATLYPPAFATLTHWAGEQRVKALTAVTLIAGFASTVFAPLTAVLESQVGWRNTYLLLAVPLALTVPAHWWGLGSPWVLRQPAAPSPEATTDLPAGPDRNVLRQPEFILLTAALTLAGFCVYAVVVNLVPFLVENGLSTTEAAVALGVGGAGQVAGRLVYGPVLTRLAVRPRTIAVLGSASLTTLLLAFASGSVLLACVASFGAGTARGVFTLVQATAVSDRWGTQQFGTRNSVLSGGTTAAAAIAPWAGAALAAACGGYDTALAILGLGAACSVVLVRPHRGGPDVAASRQANADGTSV